MGFGIFFAKTFVKSIALLLAGKKSLLIAIKDFIKNARDIDFHKQEQLKRISISKNAKNLVEIKKLILHSIANKNIRRF